jgi:hypothetical protein
MIDVNALSSWGTIIGGFATAIGILVALIAIWVQARHSSSSLRTEVLLRLWEQFDSENMRTDRKKAASALLIWINQGKKDTPTTGLHSLDRILNFFELVGLLLLKQEVIDYDSTKTMFAFWCTAYWQAAEQPAMSGESSYVADSRNDNDLLWQSAGNLAKRFSAGISQMDQEKLKDFLASETQLG